MLGHGKSGCACMNSYVMALFFDNSNQFQSAFVSIAPVDIFGLRDSDEYQIASVHGMLCVRVLLFASTIIALYAHILSHVSVVHHAASVSHGSDIYFIKISQVKSGRVTMNFQSNTN